MRPSYRADHVESLLRPQDLVDARNNPRISRGDLSNLQDKHILADLAPPVLGLVSSKLPEMRHHDQRKLRLVIETARKVWKDA